jgi:uncharacterized protein YecT (DUF1311 family)
VRLLGILLITLPSMSWAQPADPCRTLSNTIEDRACANQKFEEQDRLLNQAYLAVLKVVSNTNPEGYSGDTARQLLVKAQRRWVEFRDADCKARRQVFVAGTVNVVVHLDCMSERTRQRIKELEAGGWQGG